MDNFHILKMTLHFWSRPLHSLSQDEEKTRTVRTFNERFSVTSVAETGFLNGSLE